MPEYLRVIEEEDLCPVYTSFPVDCPVPLGGQVGLVLRETYERYERAAAELKEAGDALYRAIREQPLPPGTPAWLHGVR